MTKYFADPKYYLEFIDQSHSSATCCNVIFSNWILSNVHGAGYEQSKIAHDPPAPRTYMYTANSLQKSLPDVLFFGVIQH